MNTCEQKPISCFLYGYGGANNTGADVRILAIIDDIRESLGPSTWITVGTINAAKTARSLPEDSRIKVVQIPYIFPLAILRLVSRHDITFLVEGSTFKQNWSTVLLYTFLWAAWCARRLGRRCVAYAVDVGELSPINRWFTMTVCRNIDLLITRTEIARERLAAMGVRRPILANTDPGFRYIADDGRISAKTNARRTVGIAPIEFFQWPVRVKLLGRKEDCYHWPYYFSWDRDRHHKSDEMATVFRGLIEHCRREHGLDVTLIAMEELDERFCLKILNGLPEMTRSEIRLVSAKDTPPSPMVAALRSLDYLVTSRYHACILSMKAAVPQMAICHDERLESVYRELETDELLLHYRDPRLAEKLISRFDRLVAQGEWYSAHLSRKHDQCFLPRCRQNRDDLTSWASLDGNLARLSSILGSSQSTSVSA